MGCEMDGTIMHRGWEACLRELPWVCGRDLSLVGVSFVFDKGIDSLDNHRFDLLQPNSSHLRWVLLPTEINS